MTAKDGKSRDILRLGAGEARGLSVHSKNVLLSLAI